MNQHDRVEQLIAENDERAGRARNVANALIKIEDAIGLLAAHLHRDLTDHEARNELAGYLDNLRRAVRAVQDDL